MKLNIIPQAPSIVRLALFVLCCLGGTQAIAGSTDISTIPPSTLTSSTVRPNLMFILDDSGSMAWDFVPDSVGSDGNKACFGYSGHNGVFFDPSITYSLPSDGAGGQKANASFTAAKNDGYVSSSSTVDLSVPSNLNSYSYTVKDSCLLSDSACTNSTVTSPDGFKISDISVGSCRRGVCPRSTVVTQYYYYTTLNSGATDDCAATSYTPVTTLSATDKQKYANWYQYYRTRMLMMRSAAGRVFDAIDPSRFRVGFTTISESGVADGNKFLNIGDFKTDSGDTTQKTNFFKKLYGQTPSGSTPLRSSLLKVGRYFAKKVSNQSTDPMQYSCQRNYALLSTDGYWNTAAEPGQPYYVPTMMDGKTEIGDQDGNAARPMLDASKSRNSLADIAKYYYDTDLRTPALGNCTGSVSGQNVCTNRDPRPGDSSPVYQNMATFTLGLGVPGVMPYRTDYDTATSGAYYDILKGNADWPDPQSSTNGGYANTGNTVQSRIDDLWHAAVNSGAHYYSARNPSELVEGLTDALERITAQTGSNAAAATSTLRPVVGDDWVFLPSYETKTWVGDLGAYKFTIDSSSGAVSVPSTPQWNAYKTLANQASRKVLFFSASASNKLTDFTYSNLSSTQRAYFDNLCTLGAYKLTQCTSLTPAALLKVTGSNVVDYLRGNKQYEMWQSSADAKVFRGRQNSKGEWTPLGDVINSTPGYVRVPPFQYTDTDYSAFKAAQKDRIGVVYVGANDGMLHAFRVSDGAELWAYVPSAVIPNLYRLADSQYAETHQYFADGSPVVADVYDPNATTTNKWRTILVAGLNAGGKAVYALDVTDPNNPKALWEFTDKDLGLSFGQPVVGKNKAGQWIVAFTSGYNNTTGDGNGHLYTVDAMTGAKVGTWLATNVASGVPAGSSGSPSNLGPLNAWVSKRTDNTLERLYAGDMLGNVWRFDIDGRYPPDGVEATLLGKATSTDGTAQPITVTPQLAEVNSTYDVVAVATGRYLGRTDLGDTQVQSLYVFKDSLGASSLGALRSNSGMVKQTMDSSHAVPSVASVNWASQNGWYIDFDKSSGERVNVEMDFQAGIVTLATTIPQSTPCSPGGTSWLYAFNVAGAAEVMKDESPVLIVGLGDVLENSNGSGSGSGTGSATGSADPNLVVLSEGSDGSLRRRVIGKLSNSSGGGVSARRTSWRELIN